MFQKITACCVKKYLFWTNLWVSLHASASGIVVFSEPLVILPLVKDLYSADHLPAWFYKRQSYPVSLFLTKRKSPSLLNLTSSGSHSIASTIWAAHLCSIFHAHAHFWDVETMTADIAQEVVHHGCTQSQNDALCLALNIFFGDVQDFVGFLGCSDTSSQLFQRAVNEDFKISFLIVPASSEFNVVKAEVVFPKRFPYVCFYEAHLPPFYLLSVLWGSSAVDIDTTFDNLKEPCGICDCSPDYWWNHWTKLVFIVILKEPSWRETVIF